MRLLDITEHDRGAVRQLIVHRLQACQAVNMRALCESTGIDSRVVKMELDHLVENKEVEVLRPLPPVSSYKRNNRSISGSAEVVEHFRLIRDTDEDYLWEQGVIARFPVSRMRQDFNYAKRAHAEKSHAKRVSVPWLRRVASLAFAMPGL